MIKDECQNLMTFWSKLSQQLGEDRCQLWFGSSQAFSIVENQLIVSLANAFLKKLVQKNFLSELKQCAAEVWQQELAVSFQIAKVEQPAKATKVEQQTAPKSVARKIAKPQPKKSPSLNLNAPTFGGLVVGRSNKFAINSARMAIEGTNQMWPMLIVGTNGVGKTHLLKAIRTEYRAANPGCRAVCLTAEQFTTEFIEALQGRGLPSFRHKYRAVDLLLIDDIHFFAGKQATLDELQNTIDTLLGQNKGVVLASDRQPSQLKPLGQELLSRFAGGLICEIKRPEFETRLEIARTFSEQRGLKLTDQVLTVLATNVTAGPRELSGAVNRLMVMSMAMEVPITKSLAEQATAELAQQTITSVRLPDIERAVCDLFGVESSRLKSNKKCRTVSEPRMLAMWLARKYTRSAWSEIGEYFGRRSHSTVISAHRRVERLMTAEATVSLANQECQVEEAIRKLESTLQRA